LIRIIIDGDAQGGWMVEIHDGTNCTTYSPEAPDAMGALHMVLESAGMVTPDAMGALHMVLESAGMVTADPIPPPATDPPAA